MTPEDTFSLGEPAWVSRPATDSVGDLVTQLSSVRVRRNIEGFPFPGRCGKPELYDSAAAALGGLGRSPVWVDCDFRQMDSLDETSRHLLLETNLITHKFMSGGPGRFLLRDSLGMTTCMVNEEDHISIASTYPGLDLESALRTASDMEGALDVKLVRDAVLGYITANPSYVGTGMTATVVFHLPALDATEDISRVASTLKRDWNSLELIKLLPFGGETCGSFYSLSNRITLSVTPEEIVSNVTRASRTIVSREIYARHKMKASGGGDVNDRFWRAWGLLRHAKKLSYAEAVNAFSVVKLGADIGILPRVDDREWRRMIIGCQKYHMSLGNSVIMEQAEEPFARAAMFRRFIEGLSPAVN
jgi:protein arginine kinase